MTPRVWHLRRVAIPGVIVEESQSDEDESEEQTRPTWASFRADHSAAGGERATTASRDGVVDAGGRRRAGGRSGRDRSSMKLPAGASPGSGERGG